MLKSLAAKAIVKAALRANIDYGTAEAHTTYGRIGVKVWIYKGEVLPESKEVAKAAPVKEA